MWSNLIDKLKDKEIAWRIALYVYALDSFGKKGNLSHKRVVNLLNDCRKSVESRNIYWPNGMGLLDVIGEVRDSLDYKHLVKIWGKIADRPYDWKILDAIYREYDSSVFEIKIVCIGKIDGTVVNKVYAVDCKQDREGYFYQIHDYLFFYNTGTIKKPTIKKAVAAARKHIHSRYKTPGFRWSVSGTINIPGTNRLVTGSVAISTIEF